MKQVKQNINTVSEPAKIAYQYTLERQEIAERVENHTEQQVPGIGKAHSGRSGRGEIEGDYGSSYTLIPSIEYWAKSSTLTTIGY